MYQNENESLSETSKKEVGLLIWNEGRYINQCNNWQIIYEVILVYYTCDLPLREEEICYSLRLKLIDSLWHW